MRLPLRISLFVVTFLLVELGAISAALAAPAGWAAWRVALLAWPIAVLVGCLGRRPRSRMSEMPEFVRRAIEAQGKITPDEVMERLDADDPETVLGVVAPEPEPEPAQERLDVGVIEPADHA